MATKQVKSNVAEPKNGRIAVLVTTEFRGVFFGWIDPAAINAENITLTECRNCIYWSADVKGFIGLAVTGPNKNCRVGPSVPEFLARKVTAVARCTFEAVKAWEGEPWKN